MAKGKAQKRKRLEELTTDEFMQHGLDSAASDDEDEEYTKEKSIKPSTVQKDAHAEQKEAVTSSHKTQLDGLKDKDPEFYKFLLENDRQLLEFDDSDADDDYSDDEDSQDNDDDAANEDEEDVESEKKTKKQSADGSKAKQEKKIVVTKKMIDDWKQKLENDKTMKVMRQVMSAFHCAVVSIVKSSDDQEKGSGHLQYSADSNAFNSLTRLCIQHCNSILVSFLKLNKSKKVKGRMPLPSTAKGWSSIKTPVKTYLYDILQLLRHLMDTSMLAIVLKHAKQMSPFYACYPVIAKMYFKRLVRMWSSDEEVIHMLALLCIRQTALLLPNLYDFIIKLMYISYVKNCKFITVKHKPLVLFMRNSMVEMFALDTNAAYQIAFVYIRQLAIHLRNALTTKKDSVQAVYNWQYISCIQLWCRMIGDLHSTVLQPLIFPITQVTLGVIRLVPSARYYPLRFHCIRSLIALGKSTGTYIPISPYLTEVLETAELLRAPKPSTSKPSDFSIALKIPKNELHSKGFSEAVINNIYDLLLEHFSVMSSSIAFPELVFPASLRLKRFAKSTKVQKFSKQMKQLNDKLQEASAEMTSRRSNVDFSPKDTAEVEKWENQVRCDGNKLTKFYESWRKTQDTMAAQKTQDNDDESDNENDDDDDDEPVAKKRNTKKNKQTEQKKQKNIKTKSKIVDTNLSMEDNVEDLVLSDSD